jgi:hypothetical protein
MRGSCRYLDGKEASIFYEMAFKRSACAKSIFFDAFWLHIDLYEEASG